MARFLVCIAVCTLAPCSAWARIGVGNTAEAISHESSLIALATPVDVENIKGPGELWFTKTRLRMDEVIKGPVSTGDTVTVYDYSYGQADLLGLEKAKKEKKQLLIFAWVAKHGFTEFGGKYVLTVAHQGQSAYYADRKVTGLFTPEFDLLTEFDSLLKRTREQVAAETQFLNTYPEGKVEITRSEVPFASKAHKHVSGGSSCYLRVPEYHKPKGRSLPEEGPGKSGGE